jgi:hypothetical protein
MESQFGVAVAWSDLAGGATFSSCLRDRLRDRVRAVARTPFSELLRAR